MREQTRVYTSALPRINLQFLADMQRKLVDSSPKTQIFCDTERKGVLLSGFWRLQRDNQRGNAGYWHHDYPGRVWLPAMVHLPALWWPGCEIIHWPEGRRVS